MTPAPADAPLFLTYTEKKLRGGMETAAAIVKNVFPALQVMGMETVHASPWLHLPIPFIREPLTSLALAAAVRGRKNAPAFIMTSSMHGWALPAKRTGIPIVSFMHGPDPLFAAAAFKKNDLAYWRMRYVYAYFEKKSAVNADLVISNSPFTQRTLKEEYGISSRVLELPIDAHVFFPGSKARARKELDWSAEKTHVLFVGNPTYSKGWDIFLRLARENPAMQFNAVLVSTPAESAPNIRIFSSVERHVLATFYRAADALVFPSRFEGFGLVPMEALACDCPVIAAEVGIFHDFKPPGYFQAAHADPISFNEQLRRAVKNKAPRSSSLVHARFGFQRYASTLRAWVEELIRSKGEERI